jgi:hypothetical protein
LCFRVHRGREQIQTRRGERGGFLRMPKPGGPMPRRFQRVERTGRSIIARPDRPIIARPGRPIINRPYRPIIARPAGRSSLARQADHRSPGRPIHRSSGRPIITRRPRRRQRRKRGGFRRRQDGRCSRDIQRRIGVSRSTACPTLDASATSNVGIASAADAIRTLETRCPPNAPPAVPLVPATGLPSLRSRPAKPAACRPATHANSRKSLRLQQIRPQKYPIRLRGAP